MLWKIRRELAAFRLLLKAVPSLVLVLFVMSVFSMNLLANKSLSLPVSWLALDGGILVSWFAFLAMDMITTHFGPKAATQLSIFALLLDLLFCSLFFAASRIPGVWGASAAPGGEALINAALDSTFGGTWYVLLGSSLAFLISAFVNNFLNYAIGRAFRRHAFGEYAVRSYLSTAAGQFTDNFVFALCVSRVFFGWRLTQCLSCAAAGMLAELFCEILFSGFGYRVCKLWRREKLGAEYFAFLQES